MYVHKLRICKLNAGFPVIRTKFDPRWIEGASKTKLPQSSPGQSWSALDYRLGGPGSLQAGY